MDFEKDSVAALCARVRRLEDERELRELMSRYAFCADLGRSREWVGLFTDDGVVDVGDAFAAMSDAPAPTGRRTRFVGREELLLDFITALPHRSVEQRSQHHTVGGPVVMTVDGDEASAEGYSVLITRAPDGFDVQVAAFNSWRFRRVDGQWRIAERRLRPIGSPDVRDSFGIDG